ncbi:MAG: Mth938-like domain-containing protein [Burkholderiaceae bacterium]
MKLHAEQGSSLNTITAYGDGFIEINGRAYRSNLTLMPEGEVAVWEVDDASGLAVSHLADLAVRAPELVLLGTGTRQIFLHPSKLVPLIGAGIGVETMATGAACRTYNILMAEGRRVLAALIAP